MEKNQVVISLEHYNELRDFKINIEKNHTLCVDGYHSYTRYFVTTEKAVENCVNTINRLENEIKNLKGEKERKLSIHEIKRMSIWEFLKWRKTN